MTRRTDDKPFLMPIAIQRRQCSTEGEKEEAIPVKHFLISKTSLYILVTSDTSTRNRLQEYSTRCIIRPMNAKDYTATVPEYASRWKLNIQTVRRFIREGRLHAIKVGRCYFLNPDVIPSKKDHPSDE